MQIEDTVQGSRQAKGTSGAVHVLPYGLAGDAMCAALLAKTTAPGANDVLSSSEGWLAFEAMAGGALTLGSGDVATEAVAVAWSTVENDHAGVATLLATALSNYVATPATPPVLLANTKIIRTMDDLVSALWDGVTRIKTVGVRAIGGTPATVTVIVNVVG